MTRDEERYNGSLVLKRNMFTGSASPGDVYGPIARLQRERAFRSHVHAHAQENS